MNKKPALTVLSGEATDDAGLGGPSLVVPGLDLDLVGDEGGRVLHHEGVSPHHVLLPLIVQVLSPVAHLVLQARPVVLDGKQWLDGEKNKS